MNKYNYPDQATLRTPRRSGHSRKSVSMMSNHSTNRNPIQKENEEIGQETKRILSKGFYRLPSSLTESIKEKIEKCTENTMYYSHRTPFPQPNLNGFEDFPSIYFIEDIGFNICYDKVSDPSLNHKKVCILNSGSPIMPCRGFETGENGQECDIARKTTLFNSLSYAKNSRTMKCGFYKKCDDYVENGFIYSPGVSIIRNPDNELTSSKNKSIDIITASAVNMNKVAIKGKALKVMEKKIHTIIDIARCHGEEILVLSDFGCGRNGNDPRNIAEIFKKVLIDEENAKYFEEIYFSILDSNVLEIFESKFD